MCNKCINAVESRNDSNSAGSASNVTNLEELVKPLVGENIVIGYHPSINGEESIPLEGVMPTLAEIKIIIHYHAEMLRAVDECWRDGQSGSWEIRQFPYSNSRINYYSQFVDESEIQAIFDSVYKDFNENVPEDWHDEGANSHFNQ